ncbi:hypothetical protein DUI87_05469 [Hirundo rustica rustica]|uniref:Uncharacterized protein n=1 Tax=Hirundo rustica rustica TaxID=333673 RepID=A0A3M0KWW7_HIRRU|nr:hypothetical protein DUI87_05469 [Hirundo rustica rustica]
MDRSQAETKRIKTSPCELALHVTAAILIRPKLLLHASIGDENPGSPNLSSSVLMDGDKIDFVVLWELEEQPDPLEFLPGNSQIPWNFYLGTARSPGISTWDQPDPLEFLPGNSQIPWNFYLGTARSPGISTWDQPDPLEFLPGNSQIPWNFDLGTTRSPGISTWDQPDPLEFLPGISQIPWNFYLGTARSPGISTGDQPDPLEFLPGNRQIPWNFYLGTARSPGISTWEQPDPLQFLPGNSQQLESLHLQNLVEVLRLENPWHCHDPVMSLQEGMFPKAVPVMQLLLAPLTGTPPNLHRNRGEVTHTPKVTPLTP